MIRIQLKAALAALAFASLPALADDEGPTALDRVVVTATRSERPALDTAASVTVIEAEEIERRMQQDLKDLFRYTPGVSVGSDPTRFGISGITIRGIGGNRVLMEVDGVPVSDAFSIGSFSNAGRDLVDPELVARVEVLRGSASALYGSDAIGGVVAFTTKDGQDYLIDGSSFGGAFKAGYNSMDASTVYTGIAAFGSATTAGLVAYTHRSGHETESQGTVESTDSTRTAANPQDYATDSWLTKATLLRGDHELRFTFEGMQGDTQTEVYSSRLTAGATTTTDMDGDDSRERLRLSADWRFPGVLGFDAGQLSVYLQDGVTEQETVELRTTSGTPFMRERAFRFDQDIQGLDFTLNRDLTSGSVQHRLLTGVEYQTTDTEQIRDGLSTNLNTSVSTPVIGPDTYPVRDFPPSTTDELGLFVQDEIVWGNGVTLIPALRYDRFELTPDKDDPIFVADNPGITPVDITDSAISPKLGLLVPFAGEWRAFAQYAHGFRAPPYNDVNIGFTNLAFGYTAIPNPDLKPETSDGIELGLRYRDGGTAFEAAYFHTDYEDFIESLAPQGVDPMSGLLVFQSVNLNAVTIEGVELSGQYAFASGPDLVLHYAAASTRGRNETAGLPLDSIDPAKAVVGLDYAAPSQRWGAELIFTAVAGKDADEVSSATLFTPPGYALVDAVAWWQLAERVRLNLGLFNLADRTYWEWADVRGRLVTDPTLDRYTHAGLNGSVSLRIDL